MQGGSIVNVLQRVILVVGSAILIMVLLTTPEYVDKDGTRFRASLLGKAEIHEINSVAEALVHPDVVLTQVDLARAAIRGSAVLVATVLLYFAAGKKKGH